MKMCYIRDPANNHEYVGISFCLTSHLFLIIEIYQSHKIIQNHQKGVKRDKSKVWSVYYDTNAVVVVRKYALNQFE